MADARTRHIGSSATDPTIVNQASSILRQQNSVPCRPVLPPDQSMEPADQSAAAARADRHCSLLGASSHARGAVDALRRELLKERIREEIITSTTERRNSETKVRCEHVVPHHGLSPARQADRRRPHILLSPELRLGEAMGAPGVVMSRRPVKDRLSGWHRSQSQWHDRSAGNEESSSVCWQARPPKKTFSGVKRKCTAETSVAGHENSFGNWSCALSRVNLYSEYGMHAMDMSSAKKISAAVCFWQRSAMTF